MEELVEKLQAIDPQLATALTKERLDCMKEISKLMKLRAATEDMRKAQIAYYEDYVDFRPDLSIKRKQLEQAVDDLIEKFRQVEQS